MKRLALLLIPLIAFLAPAFSAETIQDPTPTGQVSVVPPSDTERGTEASPSLLLTHLPAPAPAPDFAPIRSPGAVRLLRAAENRAPPARSPAPDTDATDHISRSAQGA